MTCLPRQRGKIRNAAVRRKSQSFTLDGADAVVQITIEGLDEDAALHALKQADLEAMRLLDAPSRAKKLKPPISHRMLDSRGFIIMEMTDRWIYRPPNPSPAPEFLFYLIREDAQGRKVCARIELVRQLIQ
jgi:hypothetical protein